MITKFYAAKSSANRALKKAIAGYEAYVTTQSVERDEQGFYGHIVLKPASGHHLQEFLQEKGMDVVFDPAPALAEEKAAAQPMGEKDLPAPTEDEDDREPSEEEIQDVLNSHFALAYIAHGGNSPRSRCKALRTIAAGWDGTRKQFIKAAVANGILASTANANYQAGYNK